MGAFPVVDFTQENLKPGTSSWNSTCKEVLDALASCGFFIAVYDKVTPELYKDLFKSAEDVFGRPLDTKKKNVSEIPFFGYVGDQPIRPLYETVGIQNAATLEGTEEFTRIMWPDGNNEFCQVHYKYSKLVEELHNLVVKMIFNSYGVDREYDSHVDSTTYILRLSRYREPKENETKEGLNAHTDKSFITILDQNGVDGLEIQNKEGQWVTVDFTPNTFLVMSGEALVGWSNGRLDACVHRVTMNGKGTRISYGLFSFKKGILQVPEELVDEQHPLKYKPFDNIGLVRFFGSEEGFKHQLRTVDAFCGI